ncbi:malate dehydrogenase [Coemansia reversa NRRL 1564]|uniref:Malate dehydrogenase n=1 Tax=Coemansia reversa (strain ATCC 12441 / NRRL 1564) TaxID=763665 RepID=A0A2G5B4J9_COERN|nr:malate dehydrogenase [Coemansia reversa NRRL 1564]|eukprot:PIA13934.1 malate dehydrogenase [Coemansia reversa NRRL 1564]
MVSVAVLGAAGGIGQPLSLLLKLNTSVTKLHLYDIVNVPGVAADISHVATNSEVKSFLGPKQLADAVTGIDLAVIPAGVPRKPGMTRDDLFKINAGIVKTLVEAIAENSPRAFIAVISNPVNSTVPIAAEVLKAKGVFDPRRLFGVTTLDVVRASRFVRDLRSNVDAASLRVPVVGGHSGTTIVPLVSLASSPVELSESEIKELTNRIQFGGDEVVKAKDGAGSATLSMAYAGARFADSLIRGIKGESVVEPSFIALAADPAGAEEIRKLGAGDLEFFAVPVELSDKGVSRIVSLGAEPSAFEREAIAVAAEALSANITTGVNFAKGA